MAVVSSIVPAGARSPPKDHMRNQQKMPNLLIWVQKSKDVVYNYKNSLIWLVSLHCISICIIIDYIKYWDLDFYCPQRGTLLYSPRHCWANVCNTHVLHTYYRRVIHTLVNIYWHRHRQWSLSPFPLRSELPEITEIQIGSLLLF